MKWFLSDKDGMGQKDYVLLFTTLLYGIVIIPIIYMVLRYPEKYSQVALDFLLNVTTSAGKAFLIVVSFYFLKEGTSSVVGRILSHKKEMHILKDGNISKEGLSLESIKDMVTTLKPYKPQYDNIENQKCDSVANINIPNEEESFIEDASDLNNLYNCDINNDLDGQNINNNDEF